MIACPVCEHVQERGAECEVCGKALAPAAGVAGGGGFAPGPVDGLEPTAHAAATPAFAEAVPGLEPTRHDAVDAFGEPVPGVEPTLAAPVDVAAEAIPDLERTSAGLPDDGPTPLPLAPTCRYCRTPAMPGERICARCGMRLPVLPESAPAAAPEEPRRCTDCGALAPGPRCPAGGARVTRPG